MLAPGAAELRLATQLAETHGLTFYDAIYAAAARTRGATLATGDEARLHAARLHAGAREPPGAIAARPGITESL